VLILFHTPPELENNPTSVRGVPFEPLLALLICFFIYSGCGSDVENYLTPPQEGQVGGSGYLTLPAAGIRRIYFTNLEGGISVRENNAEFELLPGSESPAYPLLSPSGQHLAVVRQNASLSIVRTDLADEHLILPADSPHAMVWSPDSRRLLFSTAHPPYQLFATDFDNKNQLLLATSDTPIDMAWSADSRQVVYTGTDENAVSQVFIIGTDGQSLQKITWRNRSKSLPSWSRDGTRLTFVSFEAGSGGVYRLMMWDLNQNNMTELAFESSLFDGTLPFGAQLWSPNGRFLGFSVFGERGLSRIEFIDMQDQSRWVVTRAQFGDRLLSWAPWRGYLIFARRIEFNWYLVMKQITGEPGSEQFIMGPQKWPGYAVDWD
jgi:Tol biopolymer transport system component